MNQTPSAPIALLGALIGDAVSMPVHWYYDRTALKRDYGTISGFLAPRNPHADSILWRSTYRALNSRGEILHDQAAYWGKRGIHYHQFLKAGENTLNYQLAAELFRQTARTGHYDVDAWLSFYIDFMLTPGKHRDTYIEEYHREFFTNYARGLKPHNCGVKDVHIGGLAPVAALVDALPPETVRPAVQQHVALTHQDADVLHAAANLAEILLAVKSGQPLREAILAHAPDWITTAKINQWSWEPDDVVVGERLSPACYIKEAFPAALYLAWKYSSDFAGGICANAQVGGDNCHRAAVVGALLAQANGIPQSWLDGLLCKIS